MALEAVVFPQDLFGYTERDLCGGGALWGYDFSGLEKEQKEREGEVQDQDTGAAAPVAAGRRKRQRTKKCKNKEEVESQRMTHITVERNRRKQMNEYLGLLRSLMPSSYVPRGDQASIVGGAINYVKELEQLLQSLEVQKRIKQQSESADGSSSSTALPFADFFAFPQYSSRSPPTAANTDNSHDTPIKNSSAAVADIEVSMVESHANLKVLVKRQPKQLLKMVAGLQNLQLTTLHLNVTSTDQMVLYSFSLKMEESCPFTSVDEIATAVHQLVGKIQDEASVTEPNVM